MVFEPLVGKWYIEITDQRRKEEWARVMQKVSDELYPQAEKIVVVMDNLNTHTPAAFYQVFEPGEARRLVESPHPRQGDHDPGGESLARSTKL